MRRTQLGPLSVTLVDRLAKGALPRQVVVLNHGFGADGDDLVPLADALFSRSKALETTLFVFPAAPLTLTEYGPTARAWWRLEADRYFERAQRGEVEPVMRAVPPGMAEARRGLRAMLDALAVETKVPIGRTVLGGFSQGAMLATDTALRLDDPPAGLVILSGAAVAADEWEKLAPRRRGLAVLQTHGSADTVLPFAGAQELTKRLTAAGLDVDFVRFPGGHAIPPMVLDALAAFAANTAAR